MTLSPEIVAIIKRISSNDPTLTTLDIQANNIGPEGAKALANALKTNTTLTTLDIQANNIGPEGAKALADALKTNTILTTLKLWSNNIGPEGAKALANALKTNTTLTTLDLSRNNIGQEGANALADALRDNTTLTTLDINGNNIGYEGANALADALENNYIVTDILIADKRFSVIGERNKKHIKDVFGVAELDSSFQHDIFYKQLYESPHLIKAIKLGYIPVAQVHEHIRAQNPDGDMNFAHYTNQILIDFLTGPAELEDKHKCILDFPGIITSHLSLLIDHGHLAISQLIIDTLDIKDCSKFLESTLLVRPDLENPKSSCLDEERSAHDIEAQTIYDTLCNNIISRLPADKFGTFLTKALECLNVPFVELMVQYMCEHKMTHPISDEIISSVKAFLADQRCLTFQDVHAGIKEVLKQLTLEQSHDDTISAGAGAGGDDSGSYAASEVAYAPMLGADAGGTM